MKTPPRPDAEAGLVVQLLPLVKGVPLPCPAPAHTRRQVPAGYGVQEQCLPFTAATAIGYLVPAPITFGLCLPHDVPADAKSFRSPIERPGSASEDPRVFYVEDDPSCSFVGNAFSLDATGLAQATRRTAGDLVEPGISFFDRDDQDDLFKLHLPYIVRTPQAVDTLFLPPLNRDVADLAVLAGLVETDWYAHPVNLVIRKPPTGRALHVRAGDPVAQVVFVPRPYRKPELTVLPHHARSARDLRQALGDWYRRHAEDRSAYKRLARLQSESTQEKV